ncbi:hypothetical protein BS78_07G043600 [Paspalum vaginatum]|nr:hypothetical protein BS78_07G043600 [Paspalum vaginatum]
MKLAGAICWRKKSLEAIHEAWNMWEIHSLMLLSLSLQVLLFLTAGLRRRKTSRILRTVLWLAYLVCVRAMGAGEPVRESEVGSVQRRRGHDGLGHAEVGGRGLLGSLEVSTWSRDWWRSSSSRESRKTRPRPIGTRSSRAGAVAGGRGSWRAGRRRGHLRARRPRHPRERAAPPAHVLLGALRVFKAGQRAVEAPPAKLVLPGKIDGSDMNDVACVDVPLNTEQSILAVESLPSLLKDFWSSAGRYGAYESVESYLVNSYNYLYTKHTLRDAFYEFYTEFLPNELKDDFLSSILTFLGDKLHTSRADITLSYILLVAAMALDVSSATMFLLSKYFPHATWSRKQWSEKVGQYSMIKRHVVQGTTGLLSSIRQWIGRRLGKWGVGLLELKHTSIKEPIKALILDNLLLHGTRKEWHIASSRGLLAVQNWKERHQDTASKSTAKALEKTIRGVADFPTSVLIWHLATDICYYYSGDAANTTNDNHSDDQVKKKDNDKEVSRQIPNYIMYLVFRCGVKLTTNSQHLHDNAHKEIREILLSGPQNHRQQFSEKAAFMKIFEASKKDGEEAEQQDDSTPDGTTTQHDDTAAGDNHVKKLLQSAQAFDSPVLPRARKLAQKLISIDEGEADRWGLIAAVWSEMLYYAAPRCGGAFHYEHLSTGGEFATHVLVLMHELGPFMPPPDDPA